MNFIRHNEKFETSVVERLRKAINTAIIALICDYDYLSVTVFGLPKGDRVKATKKVFGKNRKFEGEIMLTIGKPNYRERKFLAQCKKCGTQPKQYWVSKIR